MLELLTTDTILQIAPKPLDLRMWQLRLQELLQTQFAVMADGWMFKDNNEIPDKGWVSFIRSASADSGQKRNVCLYWFVLYSNAVILYYSSDETARLGEARGFIEVDEVDPPPLCAATTALS